MATNTETALGEEVSSDSQGNIKKKRVQILTLVLRSHKFCAFLTVSYSSAASKPDSLAFFWGRKLRVSQGIPSWLPPESGCSSSPSHNPPCRPGLGTGSQRVCKLREANSLLSNSSQSSFVQKHCIILSVLPPVCWSTSVTSTKSQALLFPDSWPHKAPNSLLLHSPPLLIPITPCNIV